MTDRLQIYCHGLCKPRSPGGWGCWAWVAYEGTTKVHEAGGCIVPTLMMTDNVAEYVAVGKALHWCQEQGHTAPALFTDSATIVNQVSGSWKCDHPYLLKLRDAVRERAQTVGGVTLRWCPRSMNRAAENMAQNAYTALSDLVVGSTPS